MFRIISATDLRAVAKSVELILSFILGREFGMRFGAESVSYVRGSFWERRQRKGGVSGWKWILYQLLHWADPRVCIRQDTKAEILKNVKRHPVDHQLKNRYEKNFYIFY